MIEIPCPHEGKDFPPGEYPQLPDHHPLDRAEVEALLIEAACSARDFSNGWQQLAKVQVRLGQGIPGAVCPHDIEGLTPRVHRRLDRLFVRFCKRSRRGILNIGERAAAIMRLYNLAGGTYS